MRPAVVSPSIEMLKEVKLLRSFTDAELDRILAMGQVLSYEVHSNIVVEGELTWGIYFILQGLVGIMKANRLSGENYDVGQLQAGSFFGEISLVDDNPRSATCKALTNCSLLYISKEAFNTFLDQASDRKMRFFKDCTQHLIHRLRELDDNYVISQYQLWRFALKKPGEAESS